MSSGLCQDPGALLGRVHGGPQKVSSWCRSHVARDFFGLGHRGRKDGAEKTGSLEQRTGGSMSSFASSRSKKQTNDTVNKMLGDLLPGTAMGSDGLAKSRPAAQALSREIEHDKLSKEQILQRHRLRKLQKKKELQKTRRAAEENRKLEKQAKYELIKKHKEQGTLREEEEKYLNKLVKRNIRNIQKASEVDDEEIDSEIKRLRKEILGWEKEREDRRKVDKRKKKAFNEKIKKGVISYPGLTPGLAPVGLEDSDDE